MLPRSKTDQTGDGIIKAILYSDGPCCPPTALRAWLDAANTLSQSEKWKSYERRTVPVARKAEQIVSPIPGGQLLGLDASAAEQVVSRRRWVVILREQGDKAVDRHENVTSCMH
jgi:hypothetical protein